MEFCISDLLCEDGEPLVKPSRGRGRPPTLNPCTRSVHIRMTEWEYKRYQSVGPTVVRQWLGSLQLMGADDLFPDDAEEETDE